MSLDLSLLDEQEQRQLHHLLEELAQLQRRNMIADCYPEKGTDGHLHGFQEIIIDGETILDPIAADQESWSRHLYPKTLEFFRAGSMYKLRLFRAGNRIGKTFAALFEITCHLTGYYPDWWEGKVFNGPTDWWLCGVDTNLIKATLQPMLLGVVGSFGTGMIPYDCLDFESLKEAQKADTPITHFRVKHRLGGYSAAEFKSYESGRKAFQGSKKNIHLDEEPPLPVFTECLLRTAGDCILMMTFTPLEGLSETILNFCEDDPNIEGPVGTGKYVVAAGWKDIPHLSEKDKQIILASIPEWARDARVNGIPQMGSGAIFPMEWEQISCPPVVIGKDWKRYYGFDVGNKTAAIWFAIDPLTGTHYGYHLYYREGQLPSVHVEGLAAPGLWIPGAIDTAARQRGQIDGRKLFEMYEGLGCNIHNADKAVTTGLFTCWENLMTGKVKIFNTLLKFKEEYMQYRRDEKGNVVKKNDHIMDAFRYSQTTGAALAMNEFEAQPTRAVSYSVSPQYRKK